MGVAELSTRALREIYLRPFELACRDPETAPWALMTAYNRVNGKSTQHNYRVISDNMHARQDYMLLRINSECSPPGPIIVRRTILIVCFYSLLDSVLRKQWGWNGMVMSDWCVPEITSEPR